MVGTGEKSSDKGRESSASSVCRWQQWLTYFALEGGEYQWKNLMIDRLNK